MKIVLRDTNPNVVAAWFKVFDGIPDFDIALGNILLEKADAIVSPANSAGYMDGGIDLAYTLFFGQRLEAELQALIAELPLRTLPVGKAIAIATYNTEIPWMISAPTMVRPMPVPYSDNAFHAFRAALLISEAMGFRTISCPWLATLTGRMDPEVSAQQMLKAWRCYQRVRG